MGLPLLFLAAYWIAQAVVVVLFKYGAMTPGYWIPCYVVGNVIGVSSAALWMAALRQGSGNMVAGVAVGGAFLMQQVALVLVYRGSLSLVQAVGIAATVGGMLCLGFGARRQAGAAGMQQGPVNQQGTQVSET